MRRLAFLLVLGCTGGQTGEITELTACERVTDELRFASLDADVQRAFEDAAREAVADLRWSDGTSTTLHVTLTRQDIEVERLGVSSCAPSWRAPVVLALHTAYLAALFSRAVDSTGLMAIALAAYLTYVINAGQFVWKLRQARLDHRARSAPGVPVVLGRLEQAR